jgi:lipopolysaccharide export system protein LptA
MRWQRRLRLAIAVFGVGFAVVLYFGMRAPGKRGQAPGRVDRVDRLATAESINGEVRRLAVSAESFRVEYDGMLTYPDGRQKLTGVRVFVDKRAGRNFTVTAKEAEVGPKQDNLLMHGAVELKSSDGLAAKTGEATYSQAEGVVRAPGATDFTTKSTSGSSVGMTYDERRDVLWLLDQAVIKMAPERPTDDAVNVVSGAAGHARRDHYVRYERGFTLATGTKRLASDVATAYLSDDDARIETLEMQGRCRVAGIGDGIGAVRAMESDSLNLEFADDGRTLRGATLASTAPARAIVDIGASAARRISGQWIDVRFEADGTTVSALSVRDAVELATPATDTEPERKISASTLTAAGKADSPLNSARFAGNVAYRETRPATPPRVVQARTLELTTKPGLGAIDDARFVGAVRFEEDRMRAAAGQASYHVARGVIELDATDETTGLGPRIADDRVAIEGRRIELTLEGQKIVARENVRTVMAPASAAKAAKPGEAIRRAGLLKQDQPVYAAAAELSYDGTARSAIYSGQARLWQGDTTIQGGRVAVDDATGDLSATGKVVSTLSLDEGENRTAAPSAGAAQAPKEAEARLASATKGGPTIGTSDEMRYEDGNRHATYSGGAHVAGPQGDLRAVKIALVLGSSGHELDRVEAYETVSLSVSDRSATGSRLTYFAADGRYLLVGAPGQLTADCRETTGRALTFFKSTNNINVDPNDEMRTQVRTIPGCVPTGRN